ncbi:MAG TPA: hypothetical protein VG755_18305 [Nannocystaceae bacterium]|nr:hypothetical protein [Nannocystaceae bacterium]
MEPIAGKVMVSEASNLATELRELVEETFTSRGKMRAAVQEQQRHVALIAMTTMEAMIQLWEAIHGSQVRTPEEISELALRIASANIQAVCERDPVRLRQLFAGALGIQLLADADAEERSQLWDTACTLRPGQLRVLMDIGRSELAKHDVFVAPLTGAVLAKLKQAGAWERLQGTGCIVVRQDVSVNQTSRTVRSSTAAAKVNPTAQLQHHGRRVLELFVPHWRTLEEHKPPPPSPPPRRPSAAKRARVSWR